MSAARRVPVKRAATASQRRVIFEDDDDDVALKPSGARVDSVVDLQGSGSEEEEDANPKQKVAPAPPKDVVASGIQKALEDTNHSLNLTFHTSAKSKAAAELLQSTVLMALRETNNTFSLPVGAVEDGTQRAGETPSTVFSTRERSAPSSPAMHRPSPGSCPCLLWPIGVANPGEPEAAWSSASGLHAAFQCGPPLPTGRGTSWPDFEASREVRSRSHSSSSGLTAPIGPSLMRARVPVCAHRCDRARRERAQRRRLDHHHPGDRRHGQRRRIRALPPPAQPSKLGARRVQKVEPTHVCRDANSR